MSACHFAAAFVALVIGSAEAAKAELPELPGQPKPFGLGRPELGRNLELPRLPDFPHGYQFGRYTLPKAEPDLRSWPARAWDWYWTDKARIDPAEAGTLFGNDLLGRIANWFLGDVFAPVWNFAMAFAILRVLFLVMLAGVVASGIEAWAKR